LGWRILQLCRALLYSRIRKSLSWLGEPVLSSHPVRRPLLRLWARTTRWNTRSVHHAELGQNMNRQIKRIEQSIYEKDDWRITLQRYNSADWPYIVHNCDGDSSTEYTQCIVLQSPRTKLSYDEYIKQMKCQVCENRPPDCVITIWVFLIWDQI
jgi:hypothetical protein